MPKRKAKARPRYAEQPAVAAILKMLSRLRGATVAEIAKARGLQPHTVRWSLAGGKAQTHADKGRGARVSRRLKRSPLKTLSRISAPER